MQRTEAMEREPLSCEEDGFDKEQALLLRNSDHSAAMRLFMHGSRVLVRRMREEQSPGGIYLDPGAQDHATMGEVIAAGPGCELLHVGDKVLFGRFSGDPVGTALTLDIAGGMKDVVVMEEEDVMGHFRQEEINADA